MEVYLDDGHVILPEGMSLSPFPTELFGPLRGALARILDPGVEVQDRVFQSSPGAAKSLELQVIDPLMGGGGGGGVGIK